ncbi:hypothetical protein TMatcc_010358 [Talaromyces marneffei ATCC 18224]
MFWLLSKGKVRAISCFQSRTKQSMDYSKAARFLQDLGPQAEQKELIREHYRQPIVSAIAPPTEAPQIDPNPCSTFCAAWYIPRFLNGIKSELMIVATSLSYQ